MIISIIAAVGTTRQLGIAGELPWKIPGDLAHFKRTTNGHHILMGRKTYESIGFALPGRTNLVLSRNREFAARGIQVVSDLDEAIRIAREASEDELFIVGGSGVYEAALPKANRLYISHVNYSGEADVWFPKLDETQWATSSEEEFDAEGEAPSWRLQVLDRTR